ncbi:hypothetical protein E1B28_013764 [Marasmius oreades]|uniref:AB hydrolase-1 domain-containing protein n=1 Tax=Marasmius oreades TaxID=181124 RepID=A0A9P7RQG9_9AGAR|nr:uncharacterized protein E1B28_013764 [Marasmius oreades]KAG7087825.1 hypothetical protein E1B28_013764 [Marasmius oreades]
MFTDHTYTLSDNIQIFFTDSGPPPGSKDYSTLVVLHGCGFNGYGLEKLHGLAHQFNLRTVLWNRRDYPGSTPYTESELEELEQGQKIFIDRTGRQLGEFLVQFIEVEKIPKATDDFKAGGIAIMGWSAGAASAMMLFSDADVVPSATYSILEQYVKDLVLLEPPHACFGYELPQGLNYYYPWSDPTLKTPQQQLQQFRVWISSLYDHPDPDSGNPHHLDIMTRGSTDATVTKWSKEEIERYYTEKAAERSEMRLFMEPMQQTLREMTERVFYDNNLIESYFPRLKVTITYGTRTTWHCLWVPKEIQRIHDERVASGAKARPMKSYKMSGANHFVHWEHPYLLLKTTTEGMRR